jgi:3',5'-cyclic AMP phosphodiesterase CpdA
MKSPGWWCAILLALTSPARGGDTDFAFAVCGDSQGGDDVYRLILAGASSNAAFLIHTGDMVPYDSGACWTNFANLMAGFPLPFFPVAGNHDGGADGLADFKRWTPTHREHYSFDRGELHFAMANDSHGGMSDTELAWLDSDLDATKKPVKIVVHHLPAWSPDEPLYGMWTGREAFLLLLKKHGVRYDLCGHDHGYRAATRDGTTLVVSAGGGAPLYHPPDKGGFHHYVLFSVRGTNTTFEPVKVSAPATPSPL